MSMNKETALPACNRSVYSSCERITLQSTYRRSNRTSHTVYPPTCIYPADTVSFTHPQKIRNLNFSLYFIVLASVIVHHAVNNELANETIATMTAAVPDNEVVLLQLMALTASPDKNVAIVTLNRPDRMNCFDANVCYRLASIMASLVNDTTSSSLAAVILTGAGKNFCAGADLSNPPNPLEQSSDLPHCLERNPVYQMSRLQVPLIGALTGHCITGGFELALACDVLVGDESVVFRDTHVKFGLAPCWGLSQTLQRRIGPGRAKLASLAAVPISAKLAHEWGLLDELVMDDPMKRAVEIANFVGRNDSTMVERYKRAIDEGGAIELSKGLQRERALGLAHYLEAVQDGTTFEGAKAFITDEKRLRSKL